MNRLSNTLLRVKLRKSPLISQSTLHQKTLYQTNSQNITRNIHTTPNHLKNHNTLNLTDSAKTRLENILEKDEFLRVKVNSGGCSGFQYEFIITKEQDEDDIVCEKFIITDETSLEGGHANSEISAKNS